MPTNDSVIYSDRTYTKPMHQDEYAGKSQDEIKALRRHKDAMEQSADFVRQHWDKARRFEDLYNMVLPPELECTHSKIMVPIATAIVENEIPRQAAAVLSDSDYFDIEATVPYLEPHADAAKQWLLYQTRKVNKIFPRIIPTLKDVAIKGTGFRAVSHAVIPITHTKRKPKYWFGGVPHGFADVKVTREQLAIVSEPCDYFSIMPAPSGIAINPPDPFSEEAVPYINRITHMPKRKIQAMQGKRGANNEQIQEMLDRPPSTSGPANRIDEEYKDARLTKLGFVTPNSVRDVRDGRYPNLEKQYRVVWSFFRDQWMAVGEDRYFLYLGPPLLDVIPIVRYADNPSTNSIYGGPGLIEMAEDIILAYLLNYNLRLDYLAGTMHPQKGISQDLIDMNPGYNWDPHPYGTFKFRRNTDIMRSIWYDRFPEISPQAFMEEQAFQQKLQEMTGQPNYMKGMGGEGTLANETATGIVSLIEEGTARSSMRSLNIEYTGLQDELMLYLKFGAKYVGQYADIRIQGGDGFPWMQIDHEAITDGYGIELKGTRGLVHKNMLATRMMSILPLIIGVLNNPTPGATDVLDKALKQMDVNLNLKQIINEAGVAPVSPQMGGEAGGLGGGTPTLQNQGQAVAGAIPQAAANFAV